MLAEKGTSVSVLIELLVEDDEIVTRLLLRGKTSGRASDKDESIIRTRIDVYKRETAPVANHYAQWDKSVQVKGMGGIDEINQRLCGAIDAVKVNA